MKWLKSTVCHVSGMALLDTSVTDVLFPLLHTCLHKIQHKPYNISRCVVHWFSKLSVFNEDRSGIIVQAMPWKLVVSLPQHWINANILIFNTSERHMLSSLQNEITLTGCKY